MDLPPDYAPGLGNEFFTGQRRYRPGRGKKQQQLDEPIAVVGADKALNFGEIQGKIMIA